jgi:glycosyltransferase involved in cell wall biosynthesis
VTPVFIDRVDADSVPEADALIVYDWSSAIAASTLPEKCGRQCYFVQAEETLLGAPADFAEAALRLPCRKIVVSSWLKTALKERHGQEAEGPVISGVDFDQFQNVSSEDERVGRVGMIYWSAPYKGSRNGLRAFELARRQVPGLCLVSFSRELPDLRLPARTRFHYDPPQDELKRIYSSCAIWLSPSLMEGSGMPVQEAMACGCAVVATDVGGVRDFGRDGGNLVIVSPGDTEAMAAQIVRLCGDDTLRRRIAAAAETDIRAFTWAAAAERMEEILARDVER